MSTRQDVFTYLESHPEASLKEVLGKISQAKETTVRRYYFEFQKSDNKSAKKKITPGKKKIAAKKTTPAKKGPKKTLKQQVCDFMERSPDAKPKEAYAAFPKASTTTIGNYRRQWLKENGVAKETISKNKRAEILNYLNNNPASNIADLKKKFPEAANKVITVFRSWKNSQKGISDSAKLAEVKSAISEKGQEIKEKSQNWIEKQKETIARQKEIIEKQQTRIEALKSQLPDVKKPKFVDLLKDFIVKKVLNR